MAKIDTTVGKRVDMIRDGDLHYVRKAWPRHERQHAQARSLVARDEYILPARFDDTEVPGMTNTVGYIDLRTTSPSELVDLIRRKIGRSNS